MPNLYIIAGCNGAGKTTVFPRILLNAAITGEFIT
jgi:predicted ABC-type ATPase